MLCLSVCLSVCLKYIAVGICCKAPFFIKLENTVYIVTESAKAHNKFWKYCEKCKYYGQHVSL